MLPSRALFTADPLPLELIEGSTEKVNKIKILKKQIVGNSYIVKLIIIIKYLKHLVMKK
jgi:hypothetical protein